MREITCMSTRNIENSATLPALLFFFLSELVRDIKMISLFSNDRTAL